MSRQEFIKQLTNLVNEYENGSTEIFGMSFILNVRNKSGQVVGAEHYKLVDAPYNKTKFEMKKGMCGF